MAVRGTWIALLGVGVLGSVATAATWGGCGETAPPPTPDPAPVAEPSAPEGPAPTLIMVQAQFPGGKPGPAKAVLYRTDGERWFPEIVEDPESNVWHKGLPWRDGFLTLGAQGAHLKHWTRDDAGKWQGRALWTTSFGGKFDRLRDIEIADLDGDGQEEMAIATHDMGVVAVGDENEDGSWTFQEFDKTPDTFVHEVEVGDVDGDGKMEFYVTPSDRNKASGASQPGGVARYDVQPDGTYARTQVIRWEESHAKEILVTDLDGDGTPELYVAKEGHVSADGGTKTLVSPAAIVRLIPDGKSWREELVIELPGEKQCRFLVAGDVDHDGAAELVAAGMETGLWMIDRDGEAFSSSLVTKDSGGFEHATHLADLDGDGKLEIYAASEKKDFRLLRRFEFADGAWTSEVIAPIPPRHITWNLQDAKL
ncbi:MAG: VCBS repeat-containing protein [Myxococcales bacterium]|nr:VCBS repeat-containing protein [Myxococcales bacterium]